jgi:tight adherence protein C
MNAVTWLFSPVALVIALSIAAVAVLTVVLLPSQEKQVRARLARLKSVSNEGNGSGFSLPSNQFRSVGRWLAATPLIGTDEQAKMEALLSAAGMAGREKVAMFIAIKAVAGLALGVGGWLSLGYLGIMPNVLVVKAAVVIGSLLLGWRLPDIVVGRRVKRRGAKLSAGFADALDLLVICVEAGWSRRWIGSAAISSSPIPSSPKNWARPSPRCASSRGCATPSIILPSEAACRP